jgi:hypothetical protein
MSQHTDPQLLTLTLGKKSSQCPLNKLQGRAPKITEGRERKCPNNKKSGSKMQNTVFVTMGNSFH